MKSRNIRYLLLLAITILTAGSILLFPRIVIQDDMTYFLPDDSRMKEGVDSLKKHFPEVDINAYYVKVMLPEVEDTGLRGNELKKFDGVAGITAVSTRDGYTLYQLSILDGANPKATASSISAAYDGLATVEHNANSIMPDNMALILIAGVVIVFGILFLMCPSIIEALLFIVSIGMAIILNMGTNAFLPCVSMTTNTIASVLQLVLSMDYSIILMNRFRQVLGRGESDIDKAMDMALKSASPSILSSSFTTIVSLLALVFMKFKIGLDLGLVLAKGVFFSLITIYSVLPALIVIFHKVIEKTEKRVFLIPTDRLSRFELRAQVPLSIAFVALLVASFCLSKRTEISYASIWESGINDIFPPQNMFSVLYRTEDEDKIISLSDSLASDPKVLTAIDYPSIFKKKLDVEQMCDKVKFLTDLLPDIHIDSLMLSPEVARILYYAMSHPERDERMSFGDMIELAEEASAAGLLPGNMNIEDIISDFTERRAEQETAVQEPPKPETAEKETAVQESAEQESAVQESAEPESTEQDLEDIARPTVDESGYDPYGLQGKYEFTKDDLRRPMDALEMAEYLGFSRAQSSAAYSMAKKKNGTMTPDEFITYMIDKILGNKLLRKMISDKQAEGLYFIRQEMDAVLSDPDTVEEPVIPHVPEEAQAPEPIYPEPPAAWLPEPDPSMDIRIEEQTAMEHLAEMFASGEKYSSGEIYRALDDAGINIIDKDAIDLMFTCYGSRHNGPDTTRISLDAVIDFISSDVASDETLSGFIDDSTRTMLSGLRHAADDALRMMRKEDWSLAPVVTCYPPESPETFRFVENTISELNGSLGEGNYYFVGESVMYKEMKDGFQHELVFLTILTIISIFLIVAIAFKSLIIPLILVMTVMTGVYANVFFSGLGGNTMLYLAYLIVQSILMGSTIDYGILYANYYRGFRREGLDKGEALQQAYRGSIHVIMTSGLIIILAPFIMAGLFTDPTIRSILSSLSFGALAVICLILFVVPAMLAATDRKKS